jgi:DNA invertase Pin-like site-specific DNA recombinase
MALLRPLLGRSWENSGTRKKWVPAVAGTSGWSFAYCKRHKGTKLIVATLSRLTRDTRFLLNVEVVFADLPQVPPGAMGRFFLTQMVAVAELEAGLVSEPHQSGISGRKAAGHQARQSAPCKGVSVSPGVDQAQR